MECSVQTEVVCLLILIFIVALIPCANLKYAGPDKHWWGKPGCSSVLARTDAHRFYCLPLKEAIQLFVVIFLIHCLRPQGPQVLKSPCFCLLRDRPRYRRRIRCSFEAHKLGDAFRHLRGFHIFGIFQIVPIFGNVFKKRGDVHHQISDRPESVQRCQGDG